MKINSLAQKYITPMKRYTCYLKKEDINYPDRCVFCSKENPDSKVNIFREDRIWIFQRIDPILKFFRIGYKFSAKSHLKCRATYFIKFYAAYALSFLAIYLFFSNMKPSPPVYAKFDFHAGIIFFLIFFLLFRNDFTNGALISIFDNEDYYTVKIKDENYYNEFIKLNETYKEKEAVETEISQINKLVPYLAFGSLVLFLIAMGLMKLYNMAFY